jgi:hypothetical protein
VPAPPACRTRPCHTRPGCPPGGTQQHIAGGWRSRVWVNRACRNRGTLGAARGWFLEQATIKHVRLALMDACT